MSNAFVTAWPSEDIDPCEAAFFSEKPLPPIAPREEVLEAFCAQLARERRIRGVAAAFFALLLTVGGYLAASSGPSIEVGRDTPSALAADAQPQKLPELATASVVLTRSPKAKSRSERSTAKRAGSSRRK